MTEGRLERARQYNRLRNEQARACYAEWIKAYPFELDDLDGEIWRNFSDVHLISNYGRGKSFNHGKVKILKPTLSGTCYLNFHLSINGKAKNYLVHRLVAEVFIPNPDSKPQVNHIDGHKFNNHVSNLEWATASENSRHAIATGLVKLGEERSDSKLTNEQVIYIRNNACKFTLEQLAEMFGVDMTVISDIQLGRVWKSVGGKIRDKIDARFKRKLPESQRAEIRQLYATGDYSMPRLAQIFKCAHGTIYNIVHENE